jgi:hypothetical protein
MKQIALLALALIGLLGLGAATPPRGRVLGPFAVSMNYPADLTGTPDTRLGTWGLAGAQTTSVQFHPPAGYRVRLLHVRGNYMAWARGTYQAGQHAGVSWGLTTSAPVGSTLVDDAAEGCQVYLQYAVGNGEVNEPFDIAIPNGLLGSDNVMDEVNAIFLNDEAIAIHAETTFILEFQFEKED